VYIILAVEFTLIMKGVAVVTVILVSISLKQAGFGETKVQNLKYFFKVRNPLFLRK